MRAAHQLIVSNYLNNTGPNCTFTNIGRWGTDYLDRAGITEFIEFTNPRATAAYYHCFEDSKGNPLNTQSAPGYVLTFPADDIPEANRFWSVTAYLPLSITLVPNSSQKYLVASYTPGLTKNGDGSISIYMTPRQLRGVPAANWLPVPVGMFNVLLRVYGPEGSVADNTYVPPAITVYRAKP